MHEFSIVNALLEMCEKNAQANQASRVTKVEIKIGKLSGVEPHLLETAFHTFKEESVCDGAELVMHLQDVVVRCHACNYEGALSQNEFVCPTCKSADVTVIDGEEMYLMHLEME
ncbi:hydrogenase maturation nickel metallochaperone HypA [Sulfurospirillum deleyianum]|uniref:Hydrogenase maturation factor HypA n=1 Tax=Sulfurospirillum deleyianum (strain ATCC 51133 / DSM 6946 / 5175) TaxID=525898 RepID=D1B1Z8_SULD5|nr:hydrogenase maturation nickel metallochaperone HypA [Sulfurospirillum deleyianum]ACZ12118.1 hydrogenase nickel insertion protein HypA [Sulfurospirillum deleyianum DSM 6946]